MARYNVQRQSKRQWVAVPVVIRNGGLPVDALSINISEGGIYLFAAANFSVGSQIEIEFRAPGSKHLVRTSGTVRRRAVYLYGIEFLNVAAPTDDRNHAETQLLKASISASTGTSSQAL
jgi:hypothetical protein